MADCDGVSLSHGEPCTAGLRANTTLRALDLSLNGLKDEGTNMIAEVLTSPDRHMGSTV